MPTTAYDAELQRCPRATVGAPDDYIFGQTIQSALDHIEYTPVAHSCAKETSQLGTGELWCNRKAEICAFTGPEPGPFTLFTIYVKELDIIYRVGWSTAITFS